MSDAPDLSTVDLDGITPEQFTELVKAAGDDDLAVAVRAAGTERVLDRIFAVMQEQHLPDRTRNVTATIQFVIEDEGAQHPYTVRIDQASCTTERGRADDPRSTLTMGLVPFLKLTAGEAKGPMLFMTGKLKIQGDLMFSSQVPNFFDFPG